MNLTLSFAFFTALLQLSFSIFGAEITRVSSAIHDAQTLLQIADEFLYCFMDQSSKKFPPTGQTYTDAVSGVIRSFAHQNNDSLSKTQAIVFQTNLATSIADNVDAESQQNDHPQIFPMVLQLISDCFTEITGYQPSKLIRSITSFLALLLEDTDPEWNSLRMDSQGTLSKSQSSGDLVNQTRLKTSMENYKPVSTNEIDQLVYIRRPRQTSQNFAAAKYALLADSSSVNTSSLNTRVNKRTESDPFLNDRKQSLVENNDSFKVKELETNHGTSQPGLNVNQAKPPLVILPASSNYSYSRFSVTSEFSIAFSDALKSSDDVSKAFETSLHPVLASKAYYNAIYNVVFGIRSLNPVSIARIFSMAVKATFNVLTTFQHIMTYGNVVGKYLKSRGLLTPENVMMLSSSFANFIRSDVASVRTTDSRDANIQAIIDGLVKFLVYLRVFPTVNLLDLATDFADNVFSFTGIRRRIFSSLSPVCEGLIFNHIVDNDSNFKSNLDKSSLSAISKSHNTRDDMRVEILHNSFISGNSKNCSLPSVISLFTHTFSETVSVSESLANAFERRLSGSFLSEILFPIIYNYFIKLGITDSSSHYISTTLSQLVNTSYYAMTPVVITNTISNVIGRKLFDENLLSMKNFEQLSDSYIHFLEISFRSFDSNHTTRSIITSILEGTGNFLSSQKISLAENVEIMAAYFEMALNSSIESQFSFDDGEFPPWSPWDEVSMASDFDSFSQTSDAYTSELPNTAVFSNYILDEILFYSHLSKLFYLPSITSPAGDTMHDNFLNSLFSNSVDSPQHVADLIRHEIAKTSGSIDRFSFAELFVKNLERFLTARHVLKPENAIVMARAFVSAMNEAVRQNEDSDDNLNILINTTGRFLEKYLIFGVDHVESWSSMFLSELSSHPNFLLPRLINEISPEILSPSGLLSTESSTRVKNLSLAVRTGIISSDEVDIKSFAYDLIVGASQISNDYPALKPEKALIQALLEGTAALIGIINGAYITALDVWGYQNEVSEMCEAFSGFLNL
ncbi:hypothetical protein AVEN_59224-1 [Araneus ventricosus]|uniref:Uncharacterized protein n=1 Tax=Araneus ventricosus TaxID=182803 RepID=A0A4Y2CXY4_ARAVE|nr:hypothetical protein AVEN_59224-1 [Araneus ventricosus]